MLGVKVTNCRECVLVSKLIDSINCQLAKMANNLYLNMIYMLENPVEGCKMSTLLHYKRILTYKNCNEDWATDYSVDEIASRINFLTVGCKCCDVVGGFIETTTTTTTAIPTTTTTTTSLEPTTTTTTTLAPITTTTTTTTLLVCESYGIQGYVGGGSWSGLDCLGNPISGDTVPGDTVYTGCMDAGSLVINNGYIKIIEPCVSPSTTTTTSTTIDMSDFEMLITSPTPVLFETEGVGTYTSVDNLNGTYTITAPYTVTRIYPNQFGFPILNIPITALEIINTGGLTSGEEMFAQCINMTSLDITSLNTSNFTSMERMFFRCSALTSLDVSHFDTSNVTTMQTMFYLCFNLTSLTLGNLDTSSVTTMEYMFYGLQSITSLDVSTLDTGQVTNMIGVFSDCEKLISIDLSSWDTTNVTTVYEFFYLCYDLVSVNLTGWNTSSITDMSVMFSDCFSIIKIDLSSFDFSAMVEMGGIFFNCTSLICVSKLDTTNATFKSDLFAVEGGNTSIIEHPTALEIIDLESVPGAAYSYDCP